MNKLAYNLLKSVQDALATDTDNLVPGGVWYGRAPEGAVVPYGVVLLTEGKKTFTCNGMFIQNFVVSISIYTAGGLGSILIKNIAQMLSVALDFKNKTMSIADGKLISIQPTLNTIEIETGLRDAEDVIVSKFNWEAIVSGENSI